MSAQGEVDRSAALVGRAGELERIEGLIDGLGTTGGVLVLEGEAGIGKSALLAQARRRAGEQGVEILGVEGVESEAELAFAGLHQLLQPIRGQIDQLPEPQRRALEAAFGITGAEDPDPFHVALAAYELIAGAAAAHGILIVADDTHWLDRSTMGVLTFIARRATHEPIALLAAVRPGYMTTLELARLPTLTLEPLPTDAAGALLDGTFPELHPVARSRVLQEAAGNPLALIELSRTLPSSPQSGEALLYAPMTLTERLQRAFTGRLDELPPAAREALLVVALDHQVTLSEVVACERRIGPGETGLAVLDPAVAAGLIEITGDEIRFSHPLIRAAVSQSALPTDVRATYAALAEVVVDPERRLWHRARATVGLSDELADALDGHAAIARRRGAVIAAAAALERSAELTSDPRRRGQRLVRAAEVAYELGLLDVVRRLSDQAETVELGPLESARLRWLRLTIAGDFWSQAGVTRSFVTIAQQMADAGDREMALRSLVPIAHRSWWVPSSERTRRYLVQAARDAGAETNEPRMLAVLALADPERTGAEVRRRLAELPSAALADPVAEAYRGIAAEKAGDFAGATQRLAGATAQLREQGGLVLLTQALVHYAWVATYTGDWRAGADAGAEAAELARDTRQPQYGLTGALIAALATAVNGDAEQVQRMLARSEARLVRLGGGPLLAPAHLARGAVALGDGRHDDAFTELWPVFDVASPTFHRFLRWPAVLDLVESAVSSGRTAAATEVLEDLEQTVTDADPPLLRAGVLCARPLLAGDENAEQRFADALAQDLSGYPFLRARTLFAFGRWLHRHRRNAAARAPLRAASDQFALLGAPGWSRRVGQELRAAGARTGAEPGERDQLTAQERQIAELAAQGLTNREIGERLFLSPRTVGSHLYRVFPKLGVTSRAGLRDRLAGS